MPVEHDTRSGDAPGADEGDPGDTLTDLLAPGLRALAALAHHGHVTRAAAELGTSQPALSRALRRWEAALGATLVVRHGRGVTLTPAGRAIAAAADAALAGLDDAARRAREESGVTGGRVRLAFLHTMGPVAVPRLLAELGVRHPGITVSLAQDAHESLLTALRAGRVDVVLTSPAPADPDLEVTVLDTQPLVVVVAPTHRLAQRERVRLIELADEPWVVLAHGYGLRSMTEALWAGAGLRPPVAFEGQEAATLRGLAAVGLGVALLPQERPGDGVALDPPAHREIALVTRRDRPPTPAVRALLAVAAGFAGHLLDGTGPDDSTSSGPGRAV